MPYDKIADTALQVNHGSKSTKHVYISVIISKKQQQNTQIQDNYEYSTTTNPVSGVTLHTCDG